MALESMIAAACRTDEERYRVVNPTRTYSEEHVGGVEEEVDPVEQGQASRWLRRNRPRGWRKLIDVLGLPEGGPLTAWPDDSADPDTAVCLAEAAADQEAVEAWLEAQRAAELAALAPAPVVRVPRPRTSPRPDWEWTSRAACRGAGTFLFFPSDGERAPERETRELGAKAICRGCPVRAECLDWALTYPERAGVWAGLNEDERASVRRRWMRSGYLRKPEPAPIPEGEGKHCNRCDTTKRFADFGKDNRTADGLTHTCKNCLRVNRQKNAAKQEAVA